jgi:hypothetical protein
MCESDGRKRGEGEEAPCHVRSPPHKGEGSRRTVNRRTPMPPKSLQW